MIKRSNDIYSSYILATSEDKKSFDFLRGDIVCNHGGVDINGGGIVAYDQKMTSSNKLIMCTHLGKYNSSAIDKIIQKHFPNDTTIMIIRLNRLWRGEL